MNHTFRNIVVWVLLLLVVVVVYSVIEGVGGKSDPKLRGYSSFLKDLDAGQVSEVVLKQNNQMDGTLRSGESFRTYIPYDPRLLERMEDQGVYIEVQPASSGSSPLWSIIVNWLPMIVIVGIWFFLMRQMQGGSNRALGFGKSRARLLTENTKKILFGDVAGVEEAKAELVEVVDYLKDPRKFLRLGGRIPKGVLLVGPPGTGKTLIARAVAGEADVPFFTISGSDFVEMFVGVGASRVRDMFEQARKSSPCIVFVDELDAVGRHRGAGLGGGNDEREQTLNQLLVEMDGFESSEGIILVAATNRPDVLDPALLRPGRFDRQVVVPNPDIVGREKILRVHARKVPLASDVDLHTIARGTPGFSGADLANLINEGALLAARKNRSVVSMKDLEESKDKVMMGAERRSMSVSDEEKKLTAYHEAGHALAAIHSPESDPIHKATIIPRGRALGMVMRLPERDELSYTRAKIEANLVVGMGGRVAEEIIFGPDKVTTGAASDIKMVTDLVRRMVTEWGYSEKLGTVRYNDNQEEVFLGHSVARTQNVSEATAQLIDSEVRRLIEEATNQCRHILVTRKDELELIAQALLEYETLSGQEVQAAARGETIDRPPEPEESTSTNANTESASPASGMPNTEEGTIGPMGDPTPQSAT